MLRHPLHVMMIFIITATWLSPTRTQARAPAKAAMTWYQQATVLFQKRQYKNAIKAYQRALHALPKDPRYHCHRAQFLNYIGIAQTRSKAPYKALRSFYCAAYQTKCKVPKILEYAKDRYRSMYTRWTSSIHFYTTPAKARVFRITPEGDVLLGVTPIRITLPPGTHTFKLRQTEYRTLQWQVHLEPGSHIKRMFRLTKGDEPILLHPKQPDYTPHDTHKIKTKEAEGPRAFDLPTPKSTERLPKKAEKTLPGLRLAGHIRPGPPVYKQVWFWALIGGVVTAAIVIPIAIPKERAIVLGQQPIFKR